MTPAEHYARAELLLRRGSSDLNGLTAMELFAEAQVHATLALFPAEPERVFYKIGETP